MGKLIGKSSDIRWQLKSAVNIYVDEKLFRRCEKMTRDNENDKGYRFFSRLLFTGSIFLVISWDISSKFQRA